MSGPSKLDLASSLRGTRALIEATGLERMHGTVAALRAVDLTIAPGEFVAVMGPSGCGKSTLLHLLGGLDRPTSGELRLDGRAGGRSLRDAWAVLRRRHVGFVFQFFNLIGNLTVADNVELPALLAGFSARGGARPAGRAAGGARDRRQGRHASRRCSPAGSSSGSRSRGR